MLFTSGDNNAGNKNKGCVFLQHHSFRGKARKKLFALKLFISSTRRNRRQEKIFFKVF